MKRLAGHVALVTGAAGDIGRAIAMRFVAEGARVVCTDIDLDGAQRTADAVSLNGAAIALQCDVSDPASAQASVEATESTCGRLDVLINNAAAFCEFLPVDQLDEKQWRRELDVNLTGAFLMSKFAIPAMVRAGGGSIIHVASQMGHVGAPGRAAYGVTKAGLIHLARVMAIDHGPQKIRVNSLSPGAVLTNRVIRRYGSADAVRAQLEPLYPLRRIATPGEVAAAAAFLASEDASFVTGTDLLVDGGYTAH